MLTDRRAVRIVVMRSTIHLVTADDCRFLRPLHDDFLLRAFRASSWVRGLEGADLEAVAAAGRALVEEEPRTFKELGAGWRRGGPTTTRRRWPRSVRRLRAARPGAAPGRVGRSGGRPPHQRRGVARRAAQRGHAGPAGPALPGRLRPGVGHGRPGVVGPHPAAGGDRRPGRPGGAVPQRGRGGAARPARRPPPARGRPGAGAVPAPTTTTCRCRTPIAPAWSTTPPGGRRCR